MNIGEKIAELRRERGMTQEALASQLMISPQAISKWERGVANPDLELIPEIARLFGISTDELLGLSSPKAQESELKARIGSLERLLSMLTEKDDHATREIMLRDAPRIASFDFATMSGEEKKTWKPDGLCILDDTAELICKATPAERAVSTVVDPQLILEGLSVPIDSPMHLLVHLSSEGSFPYRHLNLFVFYTTEENPNWDGHKSARSGYPVGNWCNVDIHLQSSLFRGTLTGLRIDPFDVGDGTATVDHIALMNDKGELVVDLSPLLTNQGKADGNASPRCFVQNAQQVDSPVGIAFTSIPVKTVTQVFDPMLTNDSLHVNIDKVRYIHIRMKTSLFDRNRGIFRENNVACNAEMKLYFKTEGCDDYTEQRVFSVRYLATDQMQDVYIDTTASGFWHGTLTGLRLDPIENQGASFEISQIELLEGTPKVQLSGFMSSLEEKIARLEAAVVNLESELEDVRSEAEDAMDEAEDLRSELEALRDKLGHDE